MKVVTALYDKKAEMFMQPMFSPAVGIAVRGLQDEIAKGGDGNVLALHAEDFQLFDLGLFAEDSGNFALHAAPKLLLEVSTLKKE